MRLLTAIACERRGCLYHARTLDCCAKGGSIIVNSETQECLDYMEAKPVLTKRIDPTTAAANSAEAHQAGSTVEGLQHNSSDGSNSSTGGAGADEPSGGRLSTQPRRS